MTDIKKARIKTNMRYSWPAYLVSAVLISLLMSFIFSLVHKLPAYKTLTIFVSGEVTDSKNLEKDLINKYQDKELKVSPQYPRNLMKGTITLN